MYYVEPNEVELLACELATIAFVVMENNIECLCEMKAATT